MFDSPLNQRLQKTTRYGKADAPAASELTLEKFNQLYSGMVVGSEKIHALVLGATPELRDIVLSHGHNLTTVDRDEEALKEKTAQMHYQNNPNEHVIIADWLHMNLPKNSFDVILGDGVLTALPKDTHKQLLDILHTILKPTGELLLREAAVLENRPRYAPSVHIHEFRTGQYSLFDLFFGLRLYNYHFDSIDKNTRKTYLNEFIAKTKAYVEQGLLSVNEQEQLEKIAEELEHTLLIKNDLENLIKSVFYSKSVAHDVGSGALSPWHFFLSQPKDHIELPENVPTERTNYVQDYLASANGSQPQD